MPIRGMLASLFAIALAASPGHAQTTPKKVFSCSLGKKMVSIVSTSGKLTYSFGAPGKVELSITGGPTSNNVFYMEQHYVNLEYQVRFTKDSYNYIVYSMAENKAKGSNAVSGLVVMRGTKTISDMSCSKFAGFFPVYDLSSLPEDTAVYSAM